MANFRLHGNSGPCSTKAGDLFSLEDKLIISDFEEVLHRIQEIITQGDFLENRNDQYLVEICITRLTAAIRETDSIQLYAKSLVFLLETCLGYNLRPINNNNNSFDPPHAKIASDIMSCIFRNYLKKDVMEIAVPISVKFLHKGNRHLSRNMSSYLSLAVIENAALLAMHMQPIIDSVISGNYSLARILPTIYGVNRDPINNHVMTLVSILPDCESTEKLALLSLFNLVAKENPGLLESSVPQLCDSLSSQSTASATIQVLYNISLKKPLILADHVNQYKKAAKDFPKTAMTVIQILCSIAKVKGEQSQETMDFILSILGRIEFEKHSVVLKEIMSLINFYPKLLTANLVNKVTNLEEGATSATRSYIHEIKNDFITQSSSRVTVVKVNGSKVDTGGGSKHIFQQQTPKSDSKSFRISSTGSRTYLDKAAGVPVNSPVSTSGGRFQPTHRSMTKLNFVNPNGSQQTFENRMGLHKSMTKLSASSQQNMARFNSANHVTTPQVARSVTCIANSGHSKLYGQSKVTVAQGSNSPTKSMSSGSMSGVLTVNVNQINADLARQASTVLSQHQMDLNELPPVAAAPTSSFTHIASIPTTTHHSHHQYHQSVSNHHHTPILSSSSNNAPFSLPSHSARRVPPYNSGPLPTSQPPSLGLPLPNNPTPTSFLANAGSSNAVTGSETQKSNFSNTLPSSSRRRNKSNSTSHPSQEVSQTAMDDPDGNNTKQNRMSVFEPYPMRDTVQHFCEKHLDKIKAYMTSLMVKLPLPAKCTIEERKGRKHAKLHFGCQGRSTEFCLYKSTFYTMKTRNPKTWIHLMFLALQARSTSAISTRESSVSALKHCWEILKYESISFVTLVTGAFPPPKDQDSLMHELRSHRFFDVFEYNGPVQHWGCFLCNHPERALNFMQDTEPVIEGQLKEKKGGKWKLFKKWKSRYFTLSGAKLTYKENTGVTQSLDVGSIHSVKVTKEGRRNIPKAFEIFTNDKTFILKAKDGSNAQEWVQCLSVAKAHSQARDTNLRKLAYAGSLARLNHHQGRAAINTRSSLANSNLGLRTAL